MPTVATTQDSRSSMLCLARVPKKRTSELGKNCSLDNIVFFFLNFGFIYLFMAVLGLHFCARAFSSCRKWGPLFIAVRRPLIIAASLVAEHRLQMRKLSNCGSRA